jgi:bacteriocin-like protein
MKRVVTKKLKLNSRTIKTLNQDQLKSVVGGMSGDPDTFGSGCPTSHEAGSAGCGGTGGGTPDPK